MISLLLSFAFVAALALHSPLTVVVLIVLAQGVSLGFDVGCWRRRDVVWIHGFNGRGPDAARAERSADEVRKAYRAAGLRTPIIFNVPPDITIERSTHR